MKNRITTVAFFLSLFAWSISPSYAQRHLSIAGIDTSHMNLNEIKKRDITFGFFFARQPASIIRIRASN